jgi:hypothetical protein
MPPIKTLDLKIKSEGKEIDRKMEAPQKWCFPER